jgi:hypothetical protein
VEKHGILPEWISFGREALKWRYIKALVAGLGWIFK